MDSNGKKRSVWSGVLAFFSLLGLCVLLLLLVGVFLSKKDYVGPDKIALVRIEGVLSDSRQVLRQLEKHRGNETVKAIVLRIDSPGGGVGPSQEIYQAVKELVGEGTKKVVVSMGSVAASGGYYIACAADSIVANPGTITGSIGVIMQFGNLEELFKKVGLKTIVLKTGPHKDIGSPVREMTESDKEIIQGLLDDVYEQFVEAIAEGRNLKVPQVKEIADGRIFSGKRAKELGLVDELGNLPHALELAAEMVGISERPLVIVEEEEEHSLSRLLQGVFNSRLMIPNLQAGPSLQYRWQ